MTGAVPEDLDTSMLGRAIIGGCTAGNLLFGAFAYSLLWTYADRKRRLRFMRHVTSGADGAVRVRGVVEKATRENTADYNEPDRWVYTLHYTFPLGDTPQYRGLELRVKDHLCTKAGYDRSQELPAQPCWVLYMRDTPRDCVIESEAQEWLEQFGIGIADKLTRSEIVSLVCITFYSLVLVPIVAAIMEAAGVRGMAYGMGAALVGMPTKNCRSEANCAAMSLCALSLASSSSSARARCSNATLSFSSARMQCSCALSCSSMRTRCSNASRS